MKLFQTHNNFSVLGPDVDWTLTEIHLIIGYPTHQAIERAFGMLTQRFGIYWRMFRFSFDWWPLVIMVTMKIHSSFSEPHSSLSSSCCPERL